MDREQHELQFLGFFGIVKQSLKLVFSWRKIFSRISLAIILPLSVLYLVHHQISQLLFPNIADFGFDAGGRSHNRPAAFWIFRAAYFLVLLLLSLIATSAVVFTVASLFASRPVTFAAALRALPKAWSRLAVTFFWGFLAAVVYNAVAAVIIALCGAFLGVSSAGGIVLLVVVVVLYLAGLAYLAAVWELASVVSVLEPTYGLSAVKRSLGLIRGKTLVSAFLFVAVGACFVGVEILFVGLVLAGDGGGIAGRIAAGIASCVLLTAVILIGLVVATVVYFVCKSYHHENIDISLLSDHLQGYLGNYVVLDKSNATNDVQMTQNV